MQQRWMPICILSCALMATGCAPGGYELIVDTTPEDQWESVEAAVITNVRQLTHEEMGIGDSGEAYFSPDSKRIIFQSYPPGESEYQMYTLELAEDFTARRDTLRRVSPPGGACTCGYFRPDGGGIIYASSYLNPALPNPNFYHRSGSTYTWKMPGGMDILAAELNGDNPRQLTTTAGYDAEASYSLDGKQIVFTSDRGGNPDLYIMDMDADGSNVRQITKRPGYDGGPFFSPDGKRIIFRADRRNDDHLQIFVINADGTGERQLTAHSGVVNWAPYWHPNGRSILFTTSLHGHRNYEVYLFNIETGKQQRVTYRARFDGLPVFNADGTKMMWTSQRGTSGRSQVFVADFKLPEGF